MKIVNSLAISGGLTGVCVAEEERSLSAAYRLSQLSRPLRNRSSHCPLFVT